VSIFDLSKTLQKQARQRAYIRRLDILEQSINLLKARLIISPDLFIQVYRNDHFDTTNLVLIHNAQRIYARDQVAGIWHRHPANAPHLHDTSNEGRRPINLSDFLDEVETVLAEIGLP
jgi:hypothetical protein